MQMHDGTCLTARIVKSAVQWHFLGWLVTTEVVASCIKTAQTCRIKPAETAARGRDQQPTVTRSRRNIAGGAMRKPPVKERLGQCADHLTQTAFFCHLARTSNASLKKFLLPKFPDFNVIATSFPAV